MHEYVCYFKLHTITFSSLYLPGEPHEIISGTQRSPSIVVVDEDGDGRSGPRPRIASLSAVDTHTSRPTQ